MENENYVFVITETLYKRAYHAEPWRSTHIVAVCCDFHRTVNIIRDLILEDHETLDKSGRDLTQYTKYEPNVNTFSEDSRIISFTNSNDNYFESKSYRFNAYVVE
jgi:hypothetical protein